MSKKVAVIMGSDSDLETMRPCVKRLKSFGIPCEVRVISAHRTPAAAEDFASHAEENGFGVIIAAAGKAAHLAGVLAAYTTLPVIGRAHQDLHDGRSGQPAVHGSDAQGHPRCLRGRGRLR